MEETLKKIFGKKHSPVSLNVTDSKTYLEDLKELILLEENFKEKSFKKLWNLCISLNHLIKESSINKKLFEKQRNEITLEIVRRLESMKKEFIDLEHKEVFILYDFMNFILEDYSQKMYWTRKNHSKLHLCIEKIAFGKLFETPIGEPNEIPEMLLEQAGFNHSSQQNYWFSKASELKYRMSAIRSKKLKKKVKAEIERLNNLSKEIAAEKRAEKLDKEKKKYPKCPNCGNNKNVIMKMKYPEFTESTVIGLFANKPSVVPEYFCKIHKNKIELI